MPVYQMNEHLKIKFKEQRTQGLYRSTDLECSIETVACLSGAEGEWLQHGVGC